MIRLFMLLILSSSSLWASSLCYGLKSNLASYEQVTKHEYIIYPVYCDSNEVSNAESLEFLIKVPDDVLAYRLSVVNPHETITNEYLNAITQNDLSVFTDNYQMNFLWVEPGSEVKITIPLDKSKFTFTPMSFSIEYEVYLYK